MSNNPRHTLFIWLLVLTPVGYILALGLNTWKVLRQAFHKGGKS